ncbi:formin-binding protein 4 isoform X2 [Asparagus officinalis]|uniref:formin-binding protein 4 isoform X2 n=1 Tax=Asparagus officinalis TaxID=4686 RepID=UPI00098DF3FD|nr:formin-binding protein 4 isoform X2 [Asparagus officinalis]
MLLHMMKLEGILTRIIVMWSLLHHRLQLLSVREFSGGKFCLLGQTQENPLLLLGQYSDDEVDGGTSKRPKVDGDGSSSDGLDEKELTENLGVTEKDDTSDKQQSGQVDTAENLAGTEGKENDSSYATAEANETDPVKHDNITEPSGIQVNGDLAGGWKMVVHEESNQYYYWNTVTGETSWEVPPVLAEQTISGAEGDGSQLDPHLTESATYAYATGDLGAMGVGHLISKDIGDGSSILESKNENGEVGHVGFGANQTLVHHNNSTARISYFIPAALSDFGSLAQINAVSGGVPMTEGHVLNDGHKDKHYIEPNGNCGPVDVHSSRVVKCCESLLQRLEALDRCGNHLESHEWITKEIQIRLSDCRALSSYGSSLLPFWWHTEEQLKQLETTISKGEASFVVLTDERDGNLEDTQNSLLKDEGPSQNVELEPEMENEKDISVTAKSSCHSPSFGTLKLQTEPTSQPLEYKTVATDGFSSASHHLKGEQEQESIRDSNPNSASVNLVTEGLHADDDIDMDVEMEVDEEPPSGQTASVDLHSTECPMPSEGNQPLPEFPPLPSNEPSVPPPPDEEWIPPPPPDNEPAPPPPPEEPSLPSVPPPYPDTVLCPPYPDQYNVGYAAPVYGYYPSTADVAAEVTGGNYYAEAEHSHIAGLQSSSYYEPVVTSASHEVVVDVNQVKPVAYYDVSSGTIPSAPVGTSIGSSGYHIESGPFTYATAPVSDHTASAGFTTDTGSNLPKGNSELGAPSIIAKSQVQAAFVASSAQPVGSTLVNGSAADTLPVASSKNQTKVRRKKHTVAVAPSLRSNKKVSSLVDKWKAAKEELHSEEDEEPENAYEVLEKKRQKEIEKWRAQQIASGEAQDNANFLPLGGDWREKLKRKKAATRSEAVQTPPEVVDNEKQQPDLVELSKDLPSGWQAYWDDSFKEVYYGNSITSETTWTRPTK